MSEQPYYSSKKESKKLLYRTALKRTADKIAELQLDLLTASEYAPRISAQNQLKKMAHSAVLLHDIFRQARHVA